MVPDDLVMACSRVVDALVYSSKPSDTKGCRGGKATELPHHFLQYFFDSTSVISLHKVFSTSTGLFAFLFQKAPAVSSDKPPAENPIYTSELTNPQADSHFLQSLLNCILFIFLLVRYHQNCHTKVHRNNLNDSSGGRWSGGGAVMLFFLGGVEQGRAQKGDELLSFRRDFPE